MTKARGECSLSSSTPTRDILASLTSLPHRCFVVGFAAETQNLETNAQRKLDEKNCDLLVANDVSAPTSGWKRRKMSSMIFFANGEREKLPRAKKTRARAQLAEKNLRAREKCLTKKT